MKTNTQFVHDLMEFSEYGGLAQIVVIEALRFYTQIVVQQPRPETSNKKLVSDQMWWDVNADLHRQIMTRIHPKHAEEIEKELASREGLEGAKGLARNLAALEEWKKKLD